jgi:hypothetical protein
MKKVWTIAFLMALVAIPNIVSSDDFFDPRLSVQGGDRLMEAVRAGRMYRQCALGCRGYFTKQCRRCAEKGDRCQNLNMDDCKLCLESKKACCAYMEGATELLGELGIDVNYLAGCWKGDTPLIEAIKITAYLTARNVVVEEIGYTIIRADGRRRLSQEEIDTLIAEGGVVTTRTVRMPNFKKNEEKKEAIIRELLDRKADPNTTSCYYGRGPLMEVIKMRDIKIARWLLEAGADPDGNICYKVKDIKDHCYRPSKTPLMEAASMGNLPIVKLLLKHGADQSIKDKDSRTALDWAKKKVKEFLRKQM